MTMALQVSQQDVTARIFKLPGIRHVRFVFLIVCVLSSALPRPPLILSYTLAWL